MCLWSIYWDGHLNKLTKRQIGKSNFEHVFLIWFSTFEQNKKTWIGGTNYLKINIFKNKNTIIFYSIVMKNNNWNYIVFMIDIF